MEDFFDLHLRVIIYSFKYKIFLESRNGNILKQDGNFEEKYLFDPIFFIQLWFALLFNQINCWKNVFYNILQNFNVLQFSIITISCDSIEFWFSS